MFKVTNDCRHHHHQHHHHHLHHHHHHQCLYHHDHIHHHPYHQLQRSSCYFWAFSLFFFWFWYISCKSDSIITNVLWGCGYIKDGVLSVTKALSLSESSLSASLCLSLPLPPPSASEKSCPATLNHNCLLVSPSVSLSIINSSECLLPL